MAKEYIEREAAIQALVSIKPKYTTTDNGDTYHYIRVSQVRDAISQMPATDVAPVVRSHWIIGLREDDFDIKCPVCGWSDIFEVCGIEAVERIAADIHYCQNCGAKMDGGAEGV